MAATAGASMRPIRDARSARPVAISVSVYRNLSYDPLKDFSPISMVAEVPFIHVAHPSLKVRSLAQLIALARAGRAN